MINHVTSIFIKVLNQSEESCPVHQRIFLLKREDSFASGIDR